jgi:hypothetical protein
VSRLPGSAQPGTGETQNDQLECWARLTLHIEDENVPLRRIPLKLTESLALRKERTGFIEPMNRADSVGAVLHGREAAWAAKAHSYSGTQAGKHFSGRLRPSLHTDAGLMIYTAGRWAAVS